ncbi:MAG TPA: Ig-like domain repeat protein, partial [Ilumatobacter sp.]
MIAATAVVVVATALPGGTASAATYSTTTSLSSSAATIYVGSTVTFTATVSASVTVPNGNDKVKFATVSGCGSGVLALVKPISGTATYTTSNTLASGSYTVYACYVGDTQSSNTWSPSNSSGVALTVNPKVATTTSLTLSKSTAATDEPVTLTATVTRTSGSAAVTVGSVKFPTSSGCGSNVIDTVVVDNVTGVATKSYVPGSPQGTRTIYACYLGTSSGDPQFAAST